MLKQIEIAVKEHSPFIPSIILKPLLNAVRHIEKNITLKKWLEFKNSPKYIISIFGKSIEKKQYINDAINIVLNLIIGLTFENKSSNELIDIISKEGIIICAFVKKLSFS